MPEAQDIYKTSPAVVVSFSSKNEGECDEIHACIEMLCSQIQGGWVDSVRARA